jgi:hypothetical protein
MFMKTSEFEEQFTAWLDGKLSPEDASAFEREMRDRGFDPELERSAASRTVALLREHSRTPALPHADFFNHQILHRIESSLDEPVPTPSRQRSWWGIPWLAWAGAACLLVAAALFKGLIPVGGGSLAERSTYYATVVDARTFENTVSASTVYNPKDNVTVLWLDGLDYLPADFVVQ